MPVFQGMSITLAAAWLLCLNVCLVLGGLERRCNAEIRREPPRGRFCGPRLTEMVSTLCSLRGGYYSRPSSYKRSTDADTTNGKSW